MIPTRLSNGKEHTSSSATQLYKFSELEFWARGLTGEHSWTNVWGIHRRTEASMTSKVRLVGCPEEGHQGQEEVDDVQVQGDGGPDVLVVGVALDDVVRVVDDVPAEDEGGQPTIDHL